ncbi:hypothetical protein ABET41_18475 [Metabacillus fastidiosus]|uniref:hypothetical protein n=1 Tax=Metabacillus fastidiosus TaxID=1458 RepID=UPI003D2E5E64
MSKKKIAKFGLTAAVAATTIVAATPADAAAASTTGKAVQQAAQSANALVKYYGSTDLKVSGEFTTAHNSAKKAVANAKAALAKYNGADKSKHEATVASAEEKLTNATRYIDAVNILGGELKTATNALAAEIKAGKVDDDTVINYNKLSAAIKKAEGVIGKVRGDQVRKAFGKSFLLDAKLTREALIYEVSQYQLLKQIDASVKAGQLDKADADFAKLERLKKRAVEIKEDGRKLYPGRNDVYPDLPTIEKQLRDTEKEIRDARGIETVDFVKAVNATTVEITFKGEVKGTVQASDFRIEGLDVKNAAVKQSDNKTVVLTTSAQKGGEKYTLKYNSKIAGTFDGLSSVIPTKIKVAETAIQGVVGKEVTLKADIGVKEAGVAVTFNIDAANNSLNKDQVVEAVTNADGIATYTYTQYNAGYTDTVAVYPTGAPATRDVATVFWGVDAILTVVAEDTKGNTVSNGANKVYKVTYKNAQTGKPVEGARVNVTFKENIDVTVDKLTKATVNGVNPRQLSNGSDPVGVHVTTNSKGEATFTVTGTNTKATPIVFIDELVTTTEGNKKLDSRELQVSAEQLTFAAEQVSHDITITRDGGEEAAVGNDNGKKYKVVVKTKDGKVAAGEIVNVAFNENIDRNINTNTDAVIRDHAKADEYAGEFQSGNGTKQVAIKLDSKGEAEFRVTSDTNTAYATPIAWIDINTSNAVEGNLDEGEASKVADITYFATEKVSSGTLKAYNGNTEVKSDKNFQGTDTATFKFAAANQSGTALTSQPAIKASYTVFNTGTNDVQVYDAVAVEWKTISPNRSLTVDVKSAAGATNSLDVKSSDKNASVRVEANATTDDTKATYLGNKTATAKFVSTNSVSDFYTGNITSINVADQKIFFDNKVDGVSYKNATFTGVSGASITDDGFVKLLEVGQYTATYKKDADGKIKIDLINKLAGTGITTGADTTAPKVTAVTDNGVYNTNVTPVITDANTVNATLNGAAYTSGTAVTAEGTYVLVATDAAGNTTTINFTIDKTAPTATVTSGNATGLVLTYSEALYNGTTPVASGDVKSLFTAADVSTGGATAISITSATYDATAKTVTFVIAGTEATDTITVANTVKDAAGNVVNTTTDLATFGAGGTWTLN